MSEEPRKRDIMELSQKEVGQIVAALLLGAFFIFTTGYFFGKKKMLEELSIQHHDREFADKVYNSLASMNATLEDGQDAVNGDSCGPLVSPEAVEVEEEFSPVADVEAVELVESKEHGDIAYAQLCGFGTKKSAQSYVQQLENRQIDANVVERKSRSKKGKTITWYQVVTNPMKKEDLRELVKKIKKHDKLTDVKIIDLHTDES